MKKIIAYILVGILCLAAIGGLAYGLTRNKENTKPVDEVVQEQELSSEEALKKAEEYLKTIYKDVEKETPRDYERIGVVPIGKFKFQVAWSVDVSEDYVKIVVNDNGMVTIDVNEECGEEIPYVLTATIKDEKGNIRKLTWEHVIPMKITGSYQEIVDMAYALKPGEKLENEATLQGTVTTINTPWDSGYKNITVTIVVEGREDKPIQCYRLKSGAADASQIEKGDLITVTGILKNYNGTIEFDAGCILDANEKGAGTIEKVSGTMQEIVDKAYALGKGEALKGEATLTGWVKTIDTPYNDSFKNITVTIVVDGRLTKPIQCYRMKGDDVAKVKVGDIITVTGTIKNYNGTIEFDAGCTLDKLVKGDGKAPETPIMSGTMQEIVDKAYKLAPGESFTEDAILTGKVTKVNTPWNSQYSNITVTIEVEGRENKPIKCYRLTGTNADKIAKGDTITVKGIITNYQGTDKDTGETWTEVEFKAGCQLIKWVQGVYVPPVIEDIDAPFKNGDKVVIWNPAYNKAFTTDVAASYYSAGADVNYSNGVLRNYPDSAIFEVIENSDGTYSFKQNGKKLGMADQYSSIALGSAHDKWIITETDDEKYHIMNMKREAYMEWYDANDYWSGYGTISGKFFDLDIYVIPTEVPPATLADAVAKLKTDYATEMTENGEYVLVSSINVDGTEFAVTWDVETTDASVASIVDGKLVITASTEADVEYTLTATISDAKGSEEVEWTYTVAKVEEDIETNEKPAGKSVMHLYQGNKEETLYFAGTVANKDYYLATTTDIDEAVEVFVEEVEGGVRLYFMQEDVKTYIDIYKNGTYVNARLTTEPTAVFVYNEQYNTYVADINGTDYYLGTYNTYDTISASKFQFISTSFPAAVEEIKFSYKFYSVQENLDKTLFFNGGVANKDYYLGTTENKDEAVDVYIEEVEGGVRFYFMKEDVKTYIDIYKNGSYVNARLTTSPTGVYVFNEEYDTYVVDVEGTLYYLGTYGTYSTISASKISYISTSFPAVLGNPVVSEEDTSATLADAVAALESEYADEMNVNGEYVLAPSIAIDGTEFTVTWVVETADATVAKIVDGKLVITASTEADVEYTLTATITDAAGATETWTKTATVAKVEAEVDTNEKPANKSVMHLYQGNNDKTLYFAGTVANKDYYLATTTDIEEAAEVFVEEVEGGVRLYFMNEDVKTYIDIYKNGTYVNARLTTEPTAVFVYNEQYNTYVADINGTDYYLGTYNTYDTISASKFQFISTSFPAEIEKIPYAYKFYSVQENLDKTLFFNGGVANKDYYLGTTESKDEAVDVYIEEVEGGVRFYFMKEDVKTYIDIYKSGSYVNARLTTSPTGVYVFNEEYNTYVVDVAGTLYYLGTYGTYSTLSASKINFISTSFPAVLGNPDVTE